MHVKVTGQFAEVGFLLPLYGYWGSNSVIKLGCKCLYLPSHLTNFPRALSFKNYTRFGQILESSGPISKPSTLQRRASAKAAAGDIVKSQKT